ncbi:MAG: TlpA disulfide reductase family protein [Rhodocyclaceae bacterium]|nr:TlpA disulfide reductase family protein [Rhodocyclaceae bacterium]
MSFPKSLPEALRRFRPSWSTLLLLALIAWVWFRPPAWVEDESRPLPAFSARLMDGRVMSSAELRGKVVLINVWATWCPWCKKEMPGIESFYRDYRGRGFTVLALSTDDSPEQVKRYLMEKGYSFDAAMMAPEHAAVFGEVKRLPTSFIIDPEGRLRHRIAGQVYYGRLEELVVPLLPMRH